MEHARGKEKRCATECTSTENQPRSHRLWLSTGRYGDERPTLVCGTFVLASVISYVAQETASSKINLYFNNLGWDYKK